MNEATQDRYSLLLLLSLLFFLLLSSFVKAGHFTGEGLLLLSMYVSLAAAVLELSQKRRWRLPAILLGGSSIVTMLFHFFYPTHAARVANWLLLAVFFGFISIGLFSYLGRPGAITTGRLYASVSLYFMLGVFYYAVFNLVEAVYPRSFLELGVAGSDVVSRHALLYLSLITLTTLGYGDVVPVTPPARMCAALEAVTGVLYIAITVARLVANYQTAKKT